MRKRSISILTIGIIVSILTLTTIPIIYLMKDNFIVMYGIQRYRSIRVVGTVLPIVISAVTLFISIKLSFTKKKRNVNNLDNDLLTEVKSDIKTLEEIVSQKWYYAFLEMEEIIEDVNAVIGYYKSIGEELNDEKYFELADTRSVLAKVLKAISRYLEQVNRVLRVMNKSDLSEVHQEVTICYNGINALRSKAQDFVMSVLDYMREDNAEEDALIHICSFKEVILDEVSLVDKYIKEGNM